MQEATASGSSDAAIVSSLHIALACTGLVWVLHKTKKVKTEAATLSEQLWGLEFRALSAPRRAVLALLGPLGLLALACRAWVLLGPGAAALVLGLVALALRNAGVFRVIGACLPRPWETQGRGRPGEPGGAPLPVWILTGFLGSGKTTLVNRLVRCDKGNSDLLVIENEAGETALDAELVIQASGSKESVLLLNDGCACCKVRGDLCDLVRDEVLGRRVSAGGVGGLVIECSGLADPRAVVQTFLLDVELRRRLELREVVAVVDAVHVGRYLRHRGAAPSGQHASLARLVEEQIAFASLVLLNKLDCVPSPAAVDGLREGIRRVNLTADVLECSYCDVDAARVLGGAGFQRTPGAWSPDRALLDIERVHLHVGEQPPPGSAVDSKASEAVLPGVRCVSVRVDGELDLDAFNRWVLTTLGDMEVLRAKGVLAVQGHTEKLAFQAVHASFHGTPSLTARWRLGEPRFSQLVFIGCDLRVDLIEWGLRRCRA